MTSKKQAGTSPSNFRIIQAGTEIHAIPEPDSADIAFMARQLVQATLPHSSPEGNPPGGYAGMEILFCQFGRDIKLSTLRETLFVLVILMILFPGSFCFGLRPKLFEPEAGD